MKNNKSKNNSGYSLIELVIVIAIIAVLAAMALVSVTIIHSARAKDAALKLDSEVSELITKNKNMSPDDKSNAKYGLVVYCEDDYYKIAEVITVKSSSGWDGYAKYDSTHNKYVQISTVDEIYYVDDPIVIPRTVEIEFEGKSISFKNGAEDDKGAGFKPGELDGTGAVCIMFDKRGTCTSGYGTYKFKKKNGNVVSRVTIRQNGSHEVR